jgi:hypothetical protein
VTSSHPQRPRDPNQLAKAATGQKPGGDATPGGRKESRIGARMSKDVNESSRQTAKMNRERLAPLERPAIFEEIDKKTADVRRNMARLRELRLAKEEETIRTEIATGNQPAMAKPKKRFR